MNGGPRLPGNDAGAAAASGASRTAHRLILQHICCRIKRRAVCEVYMQCTYELCECEVCESEVYIRCTYELQCVFFPSWGAAMRAGPLGRRAVPTLAVDFAPVTFCIMVARDGRQVDNSCDEQENHCDMKEL